MTGRYKSQWPDEVLSDLIRRAEMLRAGADLPGSRRAPVRVACRAPEAVRADGACLADGWDG